MAKRTEVTQALCDHARILLNGGAKAAQAAELLGVGTSTIYRMKKAGFDAAEYENVRAEEQNKTVTLVYDNTVLDEYRKEHPEEYRLTDPQIPGQMKMELPEKAEDQTKAMRFQAAMIDRLIMELDKINDTLSKFIRAKSGV